MCFTGRAWFQLDAYVNSQNRKVRCSENSNEFVEAPFHPIKFWIAISTFYFHENVNVNFYIHPIFTQLDDELVQNELLSTRQGYCS